MGRDTGHSARQRPAGGDSPRRRAGGLVVAILAAILTATAAVGDALARSAPIREATATVAPAPSDGGEAAGLTLSGWSVGGDENRTVVAVDLSETAHLRVFALAEPSRVVVDLPAARFALPSPQEAGGRALVSGWRFGSYVAGRSRLVIDTRRPVRVVRAVVETTGPQGRPRLVVELAPASRDDVVRAEPIELGRPAAAERTATVAPKADREAPAPARTRPVVVVDAGHGGVDAGTVSPATGTPEKTVVLAMAKALADRLAATGRYQVSLTRTDDVFLSLGERVRLARARHADLFVSVHADAEYDHSVRGATIYTLAEKASDEEAAALAAKENQSDALAGHAAEEAEAEVADILADLTLRETRRLSHAFARDVLEVWRHTGRLVKGQPLRQAGLRVLRAHDIPSVLVEIGFLSNKEDEALMTSAEWRERTANALVSAVDRWFAGRSALAGPTKEGATNAAASP